MSEIDESPAEDGVRSRGNVLALLGGAVAGAFAGALGRPERAAAGHDSTNVMHLGEDNFAPVGYGTQLTGEVEGFALKVINNSATNAGGIEVDSNGGGGLQVNQFGSGDGLTAIFGFNRNTGIGVAGVGGTGVEGASGDGVGVRGSSATGDAIVGQGGFTGVGGEGTVFGVHGVSANSGVRGDGEAVGVSGASETGIGVEAYSPTGTALLVNGKAAFSTAGAGTVPQGQNAVFVANTAVTAESHVSVTLVGNPGSRELRWVQRSPGSGFTVHLVPAASKPPTPFTYLIVEAAA